MVSREAPAVRLRGVKKSFGLRQVLCGVDLDVMPGEVLGLLGRNGAGKSTLISIMCGLERADAGTVSICGHDPARQNVGDLVGYAPQDIGVYPQLSVEQNLVCLGAVEGLSSREARFRAAEVMDLLGLAPQARQRARDLSGGQRRRLHAGIALMHRPRVVFLDEPTVGADVEARRGVLDAVRAVAHSGAAVVYTTHYLGEIEELGANIAVLDEGRITVAGTLREVVDAHARPTVRVRFAGGADPGMPGWLPAGGGYLEPENAMGDPGAVVAALLSSPQALGLTLDDVRVVHADLESAYLSIVGEEASDHAA